jgi:hypothetical protein
LILLTPAAGDPRLVSQPEEAIVLAVRFDIDGPMLLLAEAPDPQATTPADSRCAPT